MKFHFEPDLSFQLDAINSVCDLFRGQESCRSVFTVTMPLPRIEGILYQLSNTGYGNKLQLLQEDVLKNLQEIQLRNGLEQASELNSMDFTIEMETGTGKTYVYLRTIFELKNALVLANL